MSWGGFHFIWEKKFQKEVGSVLKVLGGGYPFSCTNASTWSCLVEVLVVVKGPLWGQVFVTVVTTKLRTVSCLPRSW